MLKAWTLSERRSRISGWVPHERPARSSLGFLGRPLNNFVQCARTPTAWPFTPAELFDFGVFTSTSEATPKFYVDYRLRAAGREPLPDDLRAVALLESLRGRTLAVMGDSSPMYLFGFLSCWALAALQAEGHLGERELAEVANASKAWHERFVAQVDVLLDGSTAPLRHHYRQRLHNHAWWVHGGQALVFPRFGNATLAYINLCHHQAKGRAAVPSEWLPYAEIALQAVGHMQPSGLRVAAMISNALEPNAGRPESAQDARDATGRVAAAVETLTRSFVQTRRRLALRDAKLMLVESQAQHFNNSYGLFGRGAPQHLPCATSIARLVPPEELAQSGGALVRTRANFKNLAVALGASWALNGSMDHDVGFVHVWSGLAQLSGIDAHWHHGKTAGDDGRDAALVTAGVADCTHPGPDSLLYQLQALVAETMRLAR